MDLPAAEVEQILAMKTSAIVAFVDRHGFPRMVPCWFYWDGAAFYTTSYADKFHVRSLLNNDRASFCIEHERHVDGRYRGNRQVKGVGRVAVLPDDDGAHLERILEKYLGDARARFPNVGDAERVALKLTPDKITAHGGDVDTS
jgi:nitroimidazol reductase NimA-like FMN-containing flavoprotein (pyridoxamine 5'-phosphate oxidase superfamily)